MGKTETGSSFLMDNDEVKSLALKLGHPSLCFYYVHVGVSCKNLNSNSDLILACPELNRSCSPDRSSIMAGKTSCPSSESALVAIRGSGIRNKLRIPINCSKYLGVWESTRYLTRHRSTNRHSLWCVKLANFFRNECTLLTITCM